MIQPSQASASTRVQTVACVGGVSLERGVPTEEVGQYIAEAENLVWMDVQDPGPEELSMLLEEFGFHPLALEDVSKGQQRPKVDEYKGYVFVVVYSLTSGAELREVQTAEVDLFVGRNYIVTVHRGRVPALEEALARWTRGGALLREGVGFLFYAIMDATIDSYFPLIGAIEEQVDETELALLTQSRQTNVQELLALKRTLSTLRRILYPLRDTFNFFLKRDKPLFSPETVIYFQDVYDHVLRMLDVLEIEREMVGGALEAHLTILSNRLNATMKTLTVVTVCVAIAGSVFGAWGMNVPMPLADWPGAFPAIVGLTVVIVGAALYVSWKRGWM